MPDLSTVPLTVLLRCCPPPLQPLPAAAEAAWRELLCRALHERRDAAWDALVAHLWPTVLGALYNRAPEITPAAADALVQQIIWHFLHTERVAAAAGAPRIPLARQLQRSVDEAVQRHGS